MSNVKTYEAFLDYFKKNRTEDDNIALEYIKRLKKVKGISPYKVVYIPDDNENSNFDINIICVHFEDTPIKIWQAIHSTGFGSESKDLLLSKGSVKYSNREYYLLKIECDGEFETCKASAQIIKELFEISKSVYKIDRNINRIDKIKINMNDAADLIN